MAKRITQETFDEVVRENMEDFEMSKDEAVEDAIKQFESQGVNLANIVKDFSTGASSDSGVHPVVAALVKLKSSIECESPDHSHVKDQLSTIAAECDKDIAHRCLASSNDAYLILYKATETYINDIAMLVHVLKTLCSLFNGQPDLINEQGMQLFMDILKKEESKDVIYLSMKLIALTCVMHEQNRQSYVNDGLVPILVEKIDKYRKNGTIVKEGCFCLRVLTFDDDIRAEFGRAHDHAKLTVTETNALKILLDISKEQSSDRSVLSEIFSTLSKLAVRSEFCQQIMDLGGMALIIESLHSSMEHRAISKQGIGLLKSIAGNDNVRDAIVTSGAVELIVAAMNKHASNAGVSEVSCSALATLALRSPANCAKIIEENGAVAIIQAMKIHQQAAAVQKKACMALRNLVSRTKEYIPHINDLGAEYLINEAQRRHKDLNDEAKAALRDLGCKVELKCLWTGEGGGIQHSDDD